MMIFEAKTVGGLHTELKNKLNKDMKNDTVNDRINWELVQTIPMQRLGRFHLARVAKYIYFFSKCDYYYALIRFGQ